MIHKEHLDKILQLFDAGVISSHKYQIDKILNIPPIINRNEYHLEINISNKSFEYLSKNESIFLDYKQIKTIVDKLNEEESLRLSKKKFNIDFCFDINSLEVYLEDDIYFGNFEIITNNTFKSEEVLNLPINEDIEDNTLRIELLNFINSNIQLVIDQLIEPEENSPKIIQQTYTLLDINSYNDLISKLNIYMKYNFYITFVEDQNATIE